MNGFVRDHIDKMMEINSEMACIVVAYKPCATFRERMRRDQGGANGEGKPPKTAGTSPRMHGDKNTMHIIEGDMDLTIVAVLWMRVRGSGYSYIYIYVWDVAAPSPKSIPNSISSIVG